MEVVPSEVGGCDELGTEVVVTEAELVGIDMGPGPRDSLLTTLPGIINKMKKASWTEKRIVGKDMEVHDHWSYICFIPGAPAMNR